MSSHSQKYGFDMCAMTRQSRSECQDRNGLASVTATFSRTRIAMITIITYASRLAAAVRQKWQGVRASVPTAVILVLVSANCLLLYEVRQQRVWAAGARNEVHSVSNGFERAVSFRARVWSAPSTVGGQTP